MIRLPGPIRRRELKLEYAEKAISLVKELLKYLELGPPIIHYGPRGEIHVDIPLMYNGYALDRMHYDPDSRTLSPKGRPGGSFGVEVSEKEVVESLKDIIGELWVVEAVEFREPEDAWVVPLAWRRYIVAHIRVSYEGTELIPDYGLTEEVRRHVT